MSTTSRQSYSDRSQHAASVAADRLLRHEGIHPGLAVLVAQAALDAAHDRESLGLDASARVEDILDELDGMLRAEAERQRATGRELPAQLVEGIADFLLREFEAKP